MRGAQVPGLWLGQICQLMLLSNHFLWGFKPRCEFSNLSYFLVKVWFLVMFLHLESFWKEGAESMCISFWQINLIKDVCECV